MQNLGTVSKWGNSLAIRIPRAIARQAHLAEGDSVSMDCGPDGEIVLQPVPKRYALEELVSRITPRNRHKETGWGAPQGKEIW